MQSLISVVEFVLLFRSTLDFLRGKLCSQVVESLQLRRCVSTCALACQRQMALLPNQRCLFLKEQNVDVFSCNV